MNKKGIVAASEPCALAAARILEVGGNAVDAAVAGVLASSSGDSSIVSLAGGGAMIVADRKTGERSILDFFVDTPGRGLDRTAFATRDFSAVTIRFEGGSAEQLFHVGRGAAAVPGVLPGLNNALQRWGTLSFGEVAEPAITNLDRGLELSSFQETCYDVVAPILKHSDGLRNLFCDGGEPKRAGDLFRNPALADLLRHLSSGRFEDVHEDRVAGAILREFGSDSGGLMSAEDLKSYQPQTRTPARSRFRNLNVYTNPAPSVGGRYIIETLRLLEDVELSSGESPENYAKFAAVFRAISEVRAACPEVLENDAQEMFRKSLDEILDSKGESGGEEPRTPGNTTHISVADAGGMLVGVSLSHGEGCGYLIGDTGMHMNNMLGEADLFPAGFENTPTGTRLATMMAPTVVEADDGACFVLGAGGSNRIRTALAQVVASLSFERPAQEAVDAARLHVENGLLSVEAWAMSDRDLIGRALGLVEDVKYFDESSLFFGGVHVAGIDAKGGFVAGADARRAGVVIEV